MAKGGLKIHIEFEEFSLCLRIKINFVAFKTFKKIFLFYYKFKDQSWI